MNDFEAGKSHLTERLKQEPDFFTEQMRKREKDRVKQGTHKAEDALKHEIDDKPSNGSNHHKNLEFDAGFELSPIDGKPVPFGFISVLKKNGGLFGKDTVYYGDFLGGNKDSHSTVTAGKQFFGSLDLGIGAEFVFKEEEHRPHVNEGHKKAAIEMVKFGKAGEMIPNKKLIEKVELALTAEFKKRFNLTAENQMRLFGRVEEFVPDKTTFARGKASISIDPKKSFFIGAFGQTGFGPGALFEYAPDGSGFNVSFVYQSPKKNIIGLGYRW